MDNKPIDSCEPNYWISELIETRNNAEAEVERLKGELERIVGPYRQFYENNPFMSKETIRDIAAVGTNCEGVNAICDYLEKEKHGNSK